MCLKWWVETFFQSMTSSPAVLLAAKTHILEYWYFYWIYQFIFKRKSYLRDPKTHMETLKTLMAANGHDTKKVFYLKVTSINIHLPQKITKVMMCPLEGGYRRSRVGSSTPVDWVGSSWQGELIWTHTFWRLWKVELFDVPVAQGGGFWTNICGQVEQVAMELHLPPIHQQKRCLPFVYIFIIRPQSISRKGVFPSFLVLYLHLVFQVFIKW